MSNMERLLIMALLFCSCETTKFVAVPQQHTEHHWHKDSVMITDSVISEKETTIMQLDSSAMAQYGIQLKEAEKAWLVRTAELDRQIQKIINLSSTNDTVRDSIPYPVEVTKEVPATLTWWQQLRIDVGGIIIFLLTGMLCWWMGGLLRKLLRK